MSLVIQQSVVASTSKTCILLNPKST